MKSPRRSGRRQQLAVSHARNWLIGKTAVTETLRSSRWPIKQLYVDTTIDNDAEILQLAETHGVSCEFATSDRLSQLCQSRHHQGVAAKMGDFPYRDTDWLKHHITPPHHNLIVICDRIQDTHNFGAILRCCDAMQAAAVIIGETQQAPVSPQVARSSAGAVNHLDIVASIDLRDTVIQLIKLGYCVSAATEKSPHRSWECNFGQPIALILGNEADGISADLLQLCQLKTGIPMLGHVESLNVAVAAGILMHEIRRQQASMKIDSEVPPPS